MGVADFYSSIFPSVGLRALAVFKGGLGAPPTHTFYDTNEALIEAAETFDKLGKNVYHGCATFKTGISRKGDNALAAKALWIDLDVGPKKPHATQKDAAISVEKFRTALGLQPPHLVKSGGGVHAYFAFTKGITAEQWQRLAATFAACLDHFGVKHDASRTQDVASILRIPGTSNYKTDPPKAVTLLRLGSEEPVADLFAKLKTYAQANLLIVGAPAKAKPKAPLQSELIGNQDYPPSEGDLISQQCPILAEVAESGGDVSYDIWWRAMGVAKHTTEPDVVAANWTRNREATGHDKSDWDKAVTEWSAGPTTCANFSNVSSVCAGCQHNGKVKSPIQLGTPAQPVVVPIHPVTNALVTAPRLPGPWEFGAQWIMDRVAQNTRTGFSNGCMTMSELQEDGTYKHKAFCDRYWQVMRRVRGSAGIWQLEIGYQEYPGRPHKTFLIDSAAVTAPEALKKAFSDRELHIYGGPRAMAKSQEILRYEQDLLFSDEQETLTLPTMGWVREGNTVRGELTGEFVIGDTMLSPNVPSKTVLLEDTVDVTLRADFRTRGTTDEWVALIDHIYNRKGAEAYQFVVAAMFAAPLVTLVPGDGDWHGIPIVLGGESGAAKTSTALAAMSIYAPPQLLRFSAQNSKDGGQGDTINALSLKVGSLRNLPCIMDEMTNVEAERVSSVMYMLANGKSRDRMGPGGKMIPNPHRWDTLSIVTANESLHEVLKTLRSGHTTEASQLRCFELWFRKEEFKKAFHNVDRTTFEVDLLEKQYGCVGRDWLQFIVNNRIIVQDYLGASRAKYKLSADDSTSIRFYKDLLVTVSCAARLAKRKGYIRWDVDAMMRWAEGQLTTLHERVIEKDWDATVSDFIASLHGRTIVSKYMKLGPGRRARELPLEPLSNNTPPVARKAFEDKMFLVTSNCLREWCTERRIMTSTMVAEMVMRGYLKKGVNGSVEPALVNLGAGTTVTRSRAPCYEFEYDQLVTVGALTEPGDSATDNVVQLKPQSVTEVVTAGDENEGEAAVSP